jgi:peptidyl-prolyl cis-trans isomerase D
MFVFWGVHTTINELSKSEDKAAATVNGEPVLEADVQSQVDMNRQQILSQMGENADPASIDEKMIREKTVNSLIEHEVLQQVADQYHLYFSDAALQQFIQEIDFFKTDGKFDQKKLDQFLVARHMTYKKLSKLLRQDQQMDQLKKGLEDSAFTTETDVARAALLDNQLRDGSYALIPVAELKNGITVDDKEIIEFYDKNKDSFISPETVVVDYLELNKQDFVKDVSVTSEDLEKQYKAELSLINAREQRRAAHILVGLSDKVNDEQAKSKIAGIAAKLKQGEDFSALAKEVSDDKGSANSGGDLGFASKGVYDPAFEQALYALNKDQVSEPIKTPFGYHIIKLLETKKDEVPTFESMKADLTKQVAEIKATELFNTKLAKLQTLTFESNDLEMPAKELNLSIQTTQTFTRKTGEGIAAQQKVIDAAFSDDVLTKGINSEPIDIGKDRVVVIHVKSHEEPTVEALEKVRADIVDKIKNKKAKELASERGKEALAALTTGDTVQKVATQYHLIWDDFTDASRVSAKIDPQVLSPLFKLPRPADKAVSLGGSILDNGDYVVLRLVKVSQNEGGDAAKREKGMRNYLGINQGRLELEDFVNEVKSYAKIKIEEASR